MAHILSSIKKPLPGFTTQNQGEVRRTHVNLYGEPLVRHGGNKPTIWNR
jgi:hypothetical protein